jgi:hypothetical protein
MKVFQIRDPHISTELGIYGGETAAQGDDYNAGLLVPSPSLPPHSSPAHPPKLLAYLRPRGVRINDGT